MNDLTTREVSQRLKDVGFEAKTQYYYYKDVHGSVTLRHDYRQAGSSLIETPAYSASTLFEYLRKNVCAWEIFHDSIEVYIKIHSVNGQGDGSDITSEEIQYNGSLADLLAEAILVTLTQEKENK